MRPRNPNVLSVREASYFLGLSPAAVYDACGRGEIPHRRVGRRILFHRPTLEAWLAGRAG